MNQTRTFLIFAWLAVATLLFMAWNREQATPPAATATAAATTPVAVDGGDSTVPTVTGSNVPKTSSPGMSATAPEADATATTVAGNGAPAISVTTDVLRVELDGGNVRQADLLRYPQTAEAGSPPMRLFASDAAHFFQAQSGWVSSTGAAPSHEAGFVPATTQRDYAMASGANHVEVPFLWTGPDGVSIRRTYTFTRGDYAVQVRDEVVNAGAKPWQGYVYRQLLRVPPVVKTGFTHPESYSFHGAAWFTAQDKFEKRKFAKYGEDAQLDKAATGGWIAMLQHHFFAAWIPGANDASTFSTALTSAAGGSQALIRELGPGVDVAPGASATTTARLWVGPKLVKQIETQKVPGLERAVDFSSYSIMAWIAGLLFAVLSFLHGVFGNWGWAIIGLVVII
jgi:YidC/Oxa1 family membrane protein insertase